MDSANGELQNLRYQATFPLLLNVGGQPTYFMAMKDAAELVKAYAMVNVQQYNLVATGNTVEECEQNYLRMLAQEELLEDGDTTLPGRETAAGAVAEIRSAVLDGNTYYFIRLEGEQVFYSVSAAASPEAVILNVGDRVELTYDAGEGSILSAASLTIQ